MSLRVQSPQGSVCICSCLSSSCRPDRRRATGPAFSREFAIPADDSGVVDAPLRQSGQPRALDLPDRCGRASPASASPPPPAAHQGSPQPTRVTSTEPDEERTRGGCRTCLTRYPHVTPSREKVKPWPVVRAGERPARGPRRGTVRSRGGLGRGGKRSCRRRLPGQRPAAVLPPRPRPPAGRPRSCGQRSCRRGHARRLLSRVTRAPAPAAAGTRRRSSRCRTLRRPPARRSGERGDWRWCAAAAGACRPPGRRSAGTGDR